MASKAWTTRLPGAAYLGFAGFCLFEQESFAKGFQSLLSSLDDSRACYAVWGMAAISAAFGLAALLGKIGDPWVSTVSRVVLALVFLAAAVPKIFDPAGFATDIKNYDMVWKPALHIMAITLPWIEALAALALLTGVMLPGAALLVNMMMVMFLIALAQAGLRGLDINCGCFGHSGAAEPVIKALVRDIFFLGWSIPLVFSGKR